MKDGWKMKKLGEVCLFENGDRGEKGKRGDLALCIV